MLRTIFLTAFPIVVSGIFATKPGISYESIRKPSWTPPPFVFPIVWTILYILMGFASSRVVDIAGFASVPAVLYFVQLVLNLSWTPVFFDRGDFSLALTILRALILTVFATTVAFWRVDTIAGAILVPYIAWLAVAHELNRSIVNSN
jgi:benzodiazapine receptor